MHGNKDGAIEPGRGPLRQGGFSLVNIQSSIAEVGLVVPWLCLLKMASSVKMDPKRQIFGLNSRNYENIQVKWRN